VLDPIEVTERYGTDAVRFTLASMASPGTDIAFSESRTEGYRAFANKIWNAARFMFMNLDRVGSGVTLTQGAPEGEMDRLENRWIMSRFYRVASEVNANLASYRFHEAANLVYNFFWGEFCDWYIEIIKPRLLGTEEEARAAVAFLGDVFEGSLRLLSPFMPFITEEIWHVMHEGKPPAKSIALVRFPESDQRWLSDQAEQQMSILQDIIVNIRNIRAEMQVLPKVKTPVRLFAKAEVRRLAEENRSMIERLANVEGVEFMDQSLGQTPGARTTVNFEVAVVYEQKIDVAADRERLTKELKKLQGEQANAHRQLGNEQFLGKAPANVVEGLKKRSSEVETLIEKIKTSLDQLG
jgi:valyl-tRNA synthetase